MAKEKGFYKKYGLNVEIKEFKSAKKVDVIDEVLKGESTFGISDSKLVYRILQGEPLKLLMPILEHSPLILVSLNPDVTSLKDIKTKNVIVSKHAIENPPIISMFKTGGVDVKDLNSKALKYDYENFLKHKAVFAIYETDELYFLEKMGLNYRLFRPVEYGFDFYGDILFTSDKECKEHPEIVRDFLKASKEGWRYAVKHTDETIETIISKYNTQNLTYEKLKDEAERMLSYLSKDFSFDYKKLENISDIYVLLNLLEVKQDIKTSVYEPLSLSESEKRFIKSRTFRCVSSYNWPPFNFLDSGKLVGIGMDYWSLIKKKISLKSKCKVVKNWNVVLNEIRSKRADINMATGMTEDRKEYAVFSKPYATFPIAIATKNSVDFISNMSYLKDKKVAIAKNYTAEKIVKKHYPDLNIIETKNSMEALALVNEGKAFAAIDILPVLAYLIAREYISTLKISGKTPYNFDMRVMIRKDYESLLPAINKAIDTISAKKRRDIYNRWISVTYQNGYTLRHIAIFLIAGGIVIVLILLWVVFLKREIRKREKLESELEEMATRDKLTNIYNRYKLDLFLSEQVEFVERYDRKFGVIFFDIDYFKKINDSYGHKVGDSVLAELARIVSRSIRSSDLFGRWGGEEFLIILPETSKKEAVKSAEKLRVIIKNHNFKNIDGITCSFGVTEYCQNDDVDSIVKRADALLYRAKKEGRDRVVF